MANAKVVVLIFWGIMCLHNYLCLVPCEEGIESIVSMVPFPLAKLLQSLFMDFLYYFTSKYVSILNAMLKF